MLLNLESQPTSNADFTPIISKNWLNSQNIKQSAPKTQNFPKLRKRLPNALESPGFLKISPNLSTFSKRPSCWCLQLLQQFLQAKSFARPSLPFPSAFLEDVTHVFSHGAGAPREVGVGGNMVMHNVPPGASRSIMAIRVFSMLLPGLKNRGFWILLSK